MNRDFKISINQLADFYLGTEAKKRRIILQQKVPNPFMISYYQLPKARIKKAIQSNGDLSSVFNGIDELILRKPKNKRQISDRAVSIEALQRFIKMKLPLLLVNTDYEVVKSIKKRSFTLNDVEIIVSPDVIIKGKIDGQIFLGGFKIHISKSNKFIREQQSIVASSIFKYLKDEVAKSGEIVLPELCVSIDLFGDGVIETNANYENTINNIQLICDEIKKYWIAA